MKANTKATAVAGGGMATTFILGMLVGGGEDLPAPFERLPDLEVVSLSCYAQPTDSTETEWGGEVAIEVGPDHIHAGLNEDGEEGTLFEFHLYHKPAGETGWANVLTMRLGSTPAYPSPTIIARPGDSVLVMLDTKMELEERFEDNNDRRAEC